MPYHPVSVGASEGPRLTLDGLPGGGGAAPANILDELEATASGFYAPNAADLQTNLVAKFTRANSESLSIADASQTGLDPAGTFTLAAWVRPTATASTQGLISKWTGTGNQLSYLLQKNSSNQYVFWISANGVATVTATSTTVANGKWQHVAAVYDGAEIIIYVNGVDEGSAVHTTGAFNSTALFGLGVQNAANFYDGDMQHAAVWSTALTPSQVATAYNAGSPVAYADNTLTTNLVSWWELNEVSGTRSDAHGSNHLTDNATVVSDFRKTVSASFTRANSEYLSLIDGADAALEAPTAFTLACWFYTGGSASTEGIVGKWGAGSDRSYLIEKSTTNTLNLFVQTGAGSYSLARAFTTSTWTFVIMTWDGSTIRGATNGGTFTSTATAGTITNSTQGFEIGRYASTNHFSGRVQNVAFWSAALTQAQADMVYHAGRAIRYEELSTELKTNLVSWWALDEVSGNRADSHGANTLTDNATVASGNGVIPTDFYPARTGAGVTRWNNSSTLGADEFGDLFAIDPLKAPRRTATGIALTSLEGLYTSEGSLAQTFGIAGHVTIDSTGLQFLCDGWQAGVSGEPRALVYDDGLTINLYSSTDAEATAHTRITGEQVWVGNFAGAASELYVNGAEKALTPTSPGTTGIEGLAMGTRFNRASPLTGTIHRLMLLPGGFSSTQVSDLQTELIP